MKLPTMFTSSVGRSTLQKSLIWTKTPNFGGLLEQSSCGGTRLLSGYIGQPSRVKVTFCCIQAHRNVGKEQLLLDLQISRGEQLVPIRHFRTSKPNYVLPPPLVLLLSRIAQGGAALLGRNVRQWWSNLTPEQKAEYTARAKGYRKFIYVGLAAIGLSVYYYYESHIQEAPYTHRKRFVALSADQFEQIARKEYQQLVENFKSQIIPASTEDPSYGRVNDVAVRLLQANMDFNEIKSKDWTVTVVKDDTIQNAIVLPCGNMFVFTGMLNMCETDDELAVIIAHEMAHAILSHGAENASYVHLLDLITVFPVAFLWTVLPSDWSSAFAHFIGSTLQNILLKLPYSRSMEVEADEVGLVLAAKACFDIRVAPVFWAKMAYVSNKKGEAPVEWLSTHPTHEHRQNRLDEKLEEALSVRKECQCPQLPPMDPAKRLSEFKRKLAEADTIENVALRLKAT